MQHGKYNVNNVYRDCINLRGYQAHVVNKLPVNKPYLLSIFNDVHVRYMLSLVRLSSVVCL